MSNILDSGNRREFGTGAVRDIQEGKGRCDLMPLDAVGTVLNIYYADNADNADNEDVGATLMRLSHFRDTGNTGYLSMALGDFLDVSTYTCWSDLFLEVAKHFEEGAKKYGENNWQKGIPTHCYIDSAVRHYLKWLRGDTDEPHDRAFCWNILCCIWTCEHHPELNDYAKEKGGEE